MTALMSFTPGRPEVAPIVRRSVPAIDPALVLIWRRSVPDTLPEDVSIERKLVPAIEPPTVLIVRKSVPETLPE